MDRGSRNWSFVAWLAEASVNQNGDREYANFESFQSLGRTPAGRSPRLALVAVSGRKVEKVKCFLGQILRFAQGMDSCRKVANFLCIVMSLPVGKGRKRFSQEVLKFLLPEGGLVLYQPFLASVNSK